MARYVDPTQEQELLWSKWVSERPKVVQDMAAHFDPWSLYLLKTSGHRVTIVSFNEGGTMTVCVSGEFNQVLFERNVFGIKPDDLEPCDIPVGEPLGAILSEYDVAENIDALRVIVRPDLWEMGDDGGAVRRD